MRVQRLLAGMAEGRVAEVVRQRHRLGQILVQPQPAGDGAGDLRHLDAMGQPGAEVIALVVDEDLGLVLQPAEGGGVDDAVAVALPGRAGIAAGLRMQPAARGFRLARPREHAAAATCACLAALPGADNRATWLEMRPAPPLCYPNRSGWPPRFAANPQENRPMPDGTDLPRFRVTPRAAAQVAEIARREGKPGAGLRVSVSAGGCSGFQYGFALEDAAPQMIW